MATAVTGSGSAGATGASGSRQADTARCARTSPGACSPQLHRPPTTAETPPQPSRYQNSSLLTCLPSRQSTPREKSGLVDAACEPECNDQKSGQKCLNSRSASQCESERCSRDRQKQYDACPGGCNDIGVET